MGTDALKNEMQGKWDKYAGQAKQKWAMLGDKDFELYKNGKTQEFAGRIQEAYGKTKQAAEDEIKEFEKNLKDASDDQAA